MHVKINSYATDIKIMDKADLLYDNLLSLNLLGDKLTSVLVCPTGSTPSYHDQLITLIIQTIM